VSSNRTVITRLTSGLRGSGFMQIHSFRLNSAGIAVQNKMVVVQSESRLKNHLEVLQKKSGSVSNFINACTIIV